MEKMKMHSMDSISLNIDKIESIFPGVITEVVGDGGKIQKSIDFDLLKQELSEVLVNEDSERYQISWPGKRESLLISNSPIAKTLRPMVDQSVDFETTQNLFVEGDNLEALKLLQESYLEKVDLIYIDPPYNTGNDFVYEDDFSENSEEYLIKSNQKSAEGLKLVANTESNGRFHSDWLSMVYPRLRIARNLMAESGLIFVSIDNGEFANLKKMMDEIFGESNFIECLVWKKKYGGGAKTKYFVGLHEFVLCYAKNKASIANLEIPYSEENRKYYKFEDEKVGIRGPYRLQPLNTNSNDKRENLIYPIINGGVEIWPESQWQWSKDRVELAQKNNELVFTKTKNGTSVNFKQYMRDEDGEERTTKPFSIIDGIYTQHGTLEIKEMFGDGKVFSFPKPVELIEGFIKILNNKNALILDFFAGSGTTGHAVMKSNIEDGGRRRFILIQITEECESDSAAFKKGFKTIPDITKERLKLSGDLMSKSKNNEFDFSDSRVDIGFRVLKVDSSNLNDIFYNPDSISQDLLSDQESNIKSDRTAYDLLFQVLLDWGVDLSLPISHEVISGKEVISVDKNALVACFDGNGGVDEDFVKKLANKQPLRVVFRDAGFKSDSVKINVEQIFKLMSPCTEVKCI